MSLTRCWSSMAVTATVLLAACAPMRPTPAPTPASPATEPAQPAQAMAQPAQPTDMGAAVQAHEPGQASPAGQPLQAPAPGDLVVLSNAGGLTAVDWAAGRIAYQTSPVVPTFDWSKLFVTRGAEPNAEQQKLDLLDGRTGAQLKSIDIPLGLVPTATSADGRLVALAPQHDSSNWSPGGLQQTQIIVVDASGATQPRVFKLDGNYEPDAFSSDNQVLFVLEYLPDATPNRYRVRQLDLRTGQVSGMLSRLKQAVPEEDMRGTRQTHVLSPDRQTLYTLYTNQPEHLHSRDLAAGLTQSSGDVYAFVHVLNLNVGWAYCLDLPEPLGIGPASAHAMALSPDGRSLYVADRSSGTLATADTDQLIVRTVTDVGASGDTTPTLGASAVVGRDGSLFLSGASELLVVDPRTLAVTRRLPLPATPTGLGMSRDGQRLFVSTQDRVLALDPLTGSQLGELPAPGTQRIEHVG